jgi:signal peptidase I
MPAWLRWTLITLAVASFVFISFFKPYRIPSGAMIPTLQIGDHVMVSRLARSPGRGDIIVFDYPKEPDKAFIKRVVAVAGDTIEGRQGVLYLNGKPVASVPVAGPCEYDELLDEGRWKKVPCRAFEEQLDGHRYHVVFDAAGEPRSFAPQTVPADSYFVLGDNRDNSHDSRYWGFVPKKLLHGTASFTAISFGPNGLRGDRFFKRVNR